MPPPREPTPSILRVLVITNMYPETPRSPFGSFVRDQVESLRPLGIEPEVLFVDGRCSDLEYLRGIGRVRRRAQEGFDLVHAHYGLTGFLAVQQRRAPVVLTFHGDDLMRTPRAGGGVTWKSRLARRLGLWAARRAARVVVVSERLRRAFPTEALRGGARVIPMGVDLTRFRPQPRDECCRRLGLDPVRRRILFLADPARPVKRFPLAAAAAGIVEHRLPGVDLHVVHGRSPEEIPLHLNASDVLLVTSLHEGGPLTVKEALACDLPVVSVDVGDVPERLAGVDGCHVVPADVEALAGAAEQVLREGRRIAGRPAAERVSLPRVATELRQLYQEVAGRVR